MRLFLCISLTLAVLAPVSSEPNPQTLSTYVIKTLSNDIWPRAIAIGPAGEIYIASEKKQIFRSDDGETFSVIAGKEHPRTVCCIDPSYAPAPLFSGDGGPAIEAYLDTPEGIAVSSEGTIYFSDSRNHRIRRVLKNGIIETVAGTGQAGFGGDNGPALAAKLNYPRGLAIDKHDNLYIADWANHRIRMIQRTGAITTVVGSGKEGFSGDGANARKAKLRNPLGVFVDDFGAIYIADTRNLRLRKVDPSGIIRTIAGNSKRRLNVDDGAALTAELFLPSSLVVDRNGTIFFTDLANGIRRISPDGILTTIGGNGQVQAIRTLSGDGEPATATPLFSSAIAISSRGTIYIDDQTRLRVLTPARR
jgi:sugar lactone lactonase YvrE